MDLAYLITSGFVGHRTVECFKPPGRETNTYINFEKSRSIRRILHKHIKQKNTKQCLWLVGWLLTENWFVRIGASSQIFGNNLNC